MFETSHCYGDVMFFGIISHSHWSLNFAPINYIENVSAHQDLNESSLYKPNVISLQTNDLIVQICFLLRKQSSAKGLVIFNPAVGGGREVRGVKNIWRPAWRGLKIFYISFKGVEKFPHCLRNPLYIKYRGSKFFDFTREGGSQNIFCSSESGVQNFCHVILNSTTPPTAEL